MLNNFKTAKDLKMEIQNKLKYAILTLGIISGTAGGALSAPQIVKHLLPSDHAVSGGLSDKTLHPSKEVRNYIESQQAAKNKTAGIFKINPSKSYIKFEAMQGGSSIKGEFKAFTADINFNPDALTESKTKVTIDMGSFTVDDADAKSVLKDPEWFSTALFPQAIFESKTFKSLGDKNYVAEGNLNIKGHSEPIKLTFKLNEFTAAEASVSGEAIIKRKAFKIGEESTDSIKDDVHVYFSIIANTEK